MDTIFDIGMYDGSDTAYYLELGYHVIAVEANPKLVALATERFAVQIASGQLTCVNAAITLSLVAESVELTLSASDLGSSSVFSSRIFHNAGTVTVPGVTLSQLIEKYGVPKYLKVDIEGADRFCVLSLTSDIRPAFLSFEIGDDVSELLTHASMIGYNRFKIINQNSYREMANLWPLYDRVTYRLMRYMGYDEPKMIRRAGRFFKYGHSSGPVPWKSDGRWRSFDETRSRLDSIPPHYWFDMHATTE